MDFKINFTPEFIEWHTEQIRSANQDGLDGLKFEKLSYSFENGVMVPRVTLRRVR